MATTETIEVKVNELKEAYFPKLEVTSLPAFYNNENYAAVLAKSIKQGLENSNYEHILFSYHGVPERHIRKSDVTKSHCKIDGSCCVTASKAHQYCYRHQCLDTTRQVAQILNLEEGTYSTTFQSRLGFDPWLQPYTDRTIENMGLKGVKNLAVVTPAFVSDCLETLEEIAMEGEEIFHEVGGQEFTVVPCLNDRDDWAQLLASWIENWQIKDLKKAIA
jgi:ferrochelatase